MFDEYLDVEGDEDVQDMRAYIRCLVYVESYKDFQYFKGQEGDDFDVEDAELRLDDYSEKIIEKSPKDCFAYLLRAHHLLRIADFQPNKPKQEDDYYSDEYSQEELENQQ